MVKKTRRWERLPKTEEEENKETDRGETDRWRRSGGPGKLVIDETTGES